MAPPSNDSELIEVRRSDVHGLGAFAVQPISKGTRILEYTGERVTHGEADRRYETKDANDSHTFLFIVDGRTVIDAGVDGNDARFLNHSCDPNCESVVEKRRVYIEALRDISPGEELTYDYQIQREDDDPENVDEVFACRCGAANCRGTMLWPTERKRPRKRSGKKASGRTGQRSAARERASQRRATGKRGQRRGTGKRASPPRGSDTGTSARGKSASSRSERRGEQSQRRRPRAKRAPTRASGRRKPRTRVARRR